MATGADGGVGTAGATGGGNGQASAWAGAGAGGGAARHSAGGVNLDVHTVVEDLWCWCAGGVAGGDGAIGGALAAQGVVVTGGLAAHGAGVAGDPAPVQRGRWVQEVSRWQHRVFRTLPGDMQDGCTTVSGGVCNLRMIGYFDGINALPGASQARRVWLGRADWLSDSPLHHAAVGAVYARRQPPAGVLHLGGPLSGTADGAEALAQGPVVAGTHVGIHPVTLLHAMSLLVIEHHQYRFN